MRTWIGISIGAVSLLALVFGIWGLGGVPGLFRPVDTQSTLPDDVGTGRMAGNPAGEDPLVPPARLPGLPTDLIDWTAGADPSGSDPDSLLHLASLTAPFAHDSGAIFHAHGHDVCPSGCAASRHPTDELTRLRFRQLMAQLALEPMDETSPAFETLLYFGRQAKEFVESEGTLPLDPARATILRRELARTHARVSIRVVDEQGDVRAWLPPTRVPLDRRHEFPMETNKVQPLQTSGTVKRVGLYHLWNRL